MAIQLPVPVPQAVDLVISALTPRDVILLTHQPIDRRSDPTAVLQAYVSYTGKPIFTFVPPVLAAQPATQAMVAQPGALETYLGPAFLALFAPAIISANLGLLLLGIATWRARVFPRGTGLLIAGGAPAMFAVGNLVPEALIIGVPMLGIAWCGYELVRGGVAQRRQATAHGEPAPQFG